jgi:bacteriorhodopsin
LTCTQKADNVSIWALSEGAHIISVDAEVVAYAVLDILAKAVSKLNVYGVYH